jgi:hypothetical protein
MDEPGQLGGAADIHAPRRQAQGSGAGRNGPRGTRAPGEGGEQGAWASASAGDSLWTGLYQGGSSGVANGHSCGGRERTQKPRTALTQGTELRLHEALD